MAEEGLASLRNSLVGAALINVLGPKSLSQRPDASHGFANDGQTLGSVLQNAQRQPLNFPRVTGAAAFPPMSTYADPGSSRSIPVPGRFLNELNAQSTGHSPVQGLRGATFPVPHFPRLDNLPMETDDAAAVLETRKRQREGSESSVIVDASHATLSSKRQRRNGDSGSAGCISDSSTAVTVSSHERGTDQHDPFCAFTKVPIAPPLFSRSLDSTPNGALNKRRILVVDDTRSIRTLLDRVFTKQGFDVCTASDGKFALSMMQNRQFDLVLLDIEMPVMNGFRCAHYMRSWEKHLGRVDHQLICALTSHNSPETQELAAKSGIDQFRTKPEPVRSLVDFVQQLIKDEHTESEYQVGQAVEVRDKMTTMRLYFPATVVRVIPGQSYDVQYEDGQVEMAVNERRVRLPQEFGKSSGGPPAHLAAPSATETAAHSATSSSARTLRET